MQISPHAGLCAACRHVKIIQSAKGSFFLLCNRAKTDPGFNKYPVLPVLQCRGFEEKSDEPDRSK